ncbi:glycoside hydrolase superfamily [Hyaloraphidium curvatum]|nr:glycoside hydrolase superfamily [Hyaloraphidium curvatum]
MQPTVVSNDKPAYPYRGIMVDTARHYIPLTDLRRTLDGMEVAKMNRLHLHLYDSQSFPLRWPGPDGQGKLWQLGAFKDAAGNPLTYSAEELAELSRYAARRGIVLVPEFDVPAHTDVFVLAYPDNMACKPDMARPSGQLQILRDSTYPLVADLLAWGMDTAFPSSPAMHVGQDEVHKWCFNWDEIVPNEQYSFLASASRFQGMLTDEIVNKRGRTLMAWEDLVTPSTMDGQGLNAEGGVPDDGTVVPRRDSLLVEAWRSMDTYRWLLGKGYRTLFSVSSYWYLSCGQWCNPGTGSISMTWAYNAPLPATGTNPNAAGGEVAFWTEETNAQVLDKVIWPRAGAAAERLWSNPGADRSRKLCTEARTAELNRQLAAVGIDAWPASTVMN